MYLLDSNICIDFMRGRAPMLRQRLQSSVPDLYKIPAIVAAELWCGAEKSKNPDKNRRIVSEFLFPFEIVPFDDSCAIEYGRIRAYLEQRGETIGPNDLLIAATASSCSAILVTNNVREFNRVPGLPVEDWRE